MMVQIIKQVKFVNGERYDVVVKDGKILEITDNAPKNKVKSLYIND